MVICAICAAANYSYNLVRFFMCPHIKGSNIVYYYFDGFNPVGLFFSIVNVALQR